MTHWLLGIHGNCWWANEDIKQGEWIWKAGEWDTNESMLVPIADLVNWNDQDREKFLALAYQIDDYTMNGFPPGIEVKSLKVSHAVSSAIQ